MLRLLPVPLAGVLVLALLGSVPAEAAPDPTTLAVEGTLRVVVVDHFDADVADGEHDSHSERLYTLVTDDGAEIPIDLDSDAPADARFRGELVVAGDVAAALDAKDLLPRAGSEIAQDTRAGRAAVAVADDQTTPLAVASSTVLPARTAAAAVPPAHEAYVAVMTDQGTVDGTVGEIGTAVDQMLAYWTTEAPGAITSFTRAGAVQTFDSTANIPPSQSCGLLDPSPIFNQAATLFPGVNFGAPGNHLIVIASDECAAAGPAGVATLGRSINDGGGAMITFDAAMFRQVGAHEIGHNFGLEHANLDGCAGCEYLDLYSVMGLAVGGAPFAPPALGTLYRNELGLSAPGETAVIAAATGQVVDQNIALAPRAATSGLRGLIVIDPVTGAKYSIESRVNTGRDAQTFYGSSYSFGPSAPKYPAGIVVERQVGSGPTYLQARPGSSPPIGSLAAGSVFAPSPGLTITVGATGPSAVVRVTLRSPKKLRTRTPKIRGTARVGKTLKVKVGSWSPRPSYRYQWYANGKKITKKGTKSSFKLTSRQKGKRITVKVTGRKYGYTTVTKTSARTKKVAKRR